MSTNRRPYFFAGLVALGLTVLAAPVAIAGGPFMHKMHKMHRGEIGPEHAAMMADHLSTKVDATDDQREQITSIIETSMLDGKTFHEEGQDLREAVHASLTQPDLDREELDELRVDMLDLVDRGSAHMLDTVFSIASILTPEQRANLPEHRPPHF